MICLLTCRIYIKKVRKFLEYQVDLNSDKKSLKLSMDKAFQLLKERGFSNFGHERWGELGDVQAYFWDI